MLRKKERPKTNKKQTKWHVDGKARVISENEESGDLDRISEIMPTKFERNLDGGRDLDRTHKNKKKYHMSCQKMW